MNTNSVSGIKDILNSSGGILTGTCCLLTLVSVVYLVYRVACLHFKTSKETDLEKAKEVKLLEMSKLNCSVYTLAVFMSLILVGAGLSIFCTLENTILSIALICIGLLFLLILLSISNIGEEDDDKTQSVCQHRHLGGPEYLRRLQQLRRIRQTASEYQVEAEDEAIRKATEMSIQEHLAKTGQTLEDDKDDDDDNLISSSLVHRSTLTGFENVVLNSQQSQPDVTGNQTSAPATTNSLNTTDNSTNK